MGETGKKAASLVKSQEHPREIVQRLALIFPVGQGTCELAHAFSVFDNPNAAGGFYQSGTEAAFILTSRRSRSPTQPEKPLFYHLSELVFD